MTTNEKPRQATERDGLLEQIRPIVEHLPPIEYHSRANGEIDYYGASFCIARQLGLDKPVFSRSTWTHGWNWYDITATTMLVDAEYSDVNNLVISEKLAEFLQQNGHPRAVAVGAPFIYADTNLINVMKIPNSILVFPKHSTKCAKHSVKNQIQTYVEYIQRLHDQFALVAVSVGYEDVRNGQWTATLEEAGIPWIAGAWSHDKNALPRMHTLLSQFEFVTSNTPGSHFAYAAYCGCKVSFHGPECLLEKQELDTHSYYKRYPEIAKEFKARDFISEFRTKFPFFFVEPNKATVEHKWAQKTLGEKNKKHPEEISELFEWKLRKLPSGRRLPLNKHDSLTSEELFAKAYAKSIVGQHDEAFKLTNILKRRHVRIKDVEILRARYFLYSSNKYGATEALKEELRHYPNNRPAAIMLQQLRGDILTPYVAKNDEEKEFIEFLNIVRPLTRLNVKRARSLYDLALRICRENVPGNFVECGVAAGGSTMLLALVVQKHSQIQRNVFAFDTFTGMPDPADVDRAKGVPADDTGWGAGTCAAPEEFVQDNCLRLGVGSIVQTRKGLFEATLPVHREEIGEIALLHMDADWYASTMTILDNLFDQLNDNALIQIDDYGAWDGCKKAILDYSTQHDLFFDVQEIDGTGVWCAKPAQAGKKSTTRQNITTDNSFLAPKLTPEFSDLYLVRKKILERLDQAIPNFSGTLLDVGCGKMPYRDHILARNPKITKYIGLDFAQGKYADLKQPDITWDGNTIPLPDASVDCAMATEVLEHCPEPSSVLKEIKRVLKPSNIFFFTTPFLWPLHDTPHDHYRYTPFSIQKLLSEAGFEDIQINALGGWNASLAQMIGLWLKRAPMPEHVRKQSIIDLFPFYEQLIKNDDSSPNFATGPMITGLTGSARVPKSLETQSALRLKPAPHDTSSNQRTTQRTVIVLNFFPVISETFILSQITGLIDRGHEIEIWARNKSDEKVIHPDVKKYNLLQKTKFINLPNNIDMANIHWFEKFKKINTNIDFEHITLFHVHFGINFNEIKPIFYNIIAPVIVSFHGLDASQYVQKNGKDCYSDLFNRATLITTPSEIMKKKLIHIGCRKDKILIHRYGVDLNFFKPLESNTTPTTNFLSVSRLVEKKGLEYSIRAFANLPDQKNIIYKIIGEGPLRDFLENLCINLNVQDNVVLLGAKNKNEVLYEMQKSSVYILTSVTAKNGDQEGLPVTLIEAQATGLPVISSIHAGIPELIEHRKTGFLCEEKSISCIEKYMRILSDHKELSYQLGKNARVRVEKEFDISTLNNTLSSIYNKIAIK